jgi:hypothetical protein
MQRDSDEILTRILFLEPLAGNEQLALVGLRQRPFGGGRSWDDARKYGFVSAGGGSWYSQTLKQLSPGDRVWVKIPKTGYVGRVAEPVQPVDTLIVPTPNGPRPSLEVLSNAERLRQHAADPEKAEYFVRVDWLDTLPEGETFSEAGLFGNQNTVCQPTTPKWRHTVERLKTVFPHWNGQPNGSTQFTSMPPPSVGTRRATTRTTT